MTGFKMLLAAMMMCVRCKRRTICDRLSVETRMHMSLTDRVVQKCSLPFSLQDKSLALSCPPVKNLDLFFLHSSEACYVVRIFILMTRNADGGRGSNTERLLIFWVHLLVQ